MANGLHKLGFVGFGAMPRRVAARLRDASLSVVAFDPAHHGAEPDGFALCSSPKSLAQQVDAVLASVPNDSALEKPMSSADGACPGQLVINFSTVSPDTSRAGRRRTSRGPPRSWAPSPATPCT